MPSRLGAEYWRQRAKEARAQAGQMHTPEAKRTMLEIAENYDQMAAQAEALVNSKMGAILS